MDNGTSNGTVLGSDLSCKLGASNELNDGNNEGNWYGTDEVARKFKHAARKYNYKKREGDEERLTRARM